ncbi:hypothetical protein GCM10027259_10970 [Micromonospora palomenae]
MGAANAAVNHSRVAAPKPAITRAPSAPPTCSVTPSILPGRCDIRPGADAVCPAATAYGSDERLDVLSLN